MLTRLVTVYLLTFITLPRVDGQCTQHSLSSGSTTLGTLSWSRKITREPLLGPSSAALTGAPPVQASWKGSVCRFTQYPDVGRSD